LLVAASALLLTFALITFSAQRLNVVIIPAWAPLFDWDNVVGNKAQPIDTLSQAHPAEGFILTMPNTEFGPTPAGIELSLVIGLGVAVSLGNMCGTRLKMGTARNR
jgi:hypothetical protein